MVLVCEERGLAGRRGGPITPGQGGGFVAGGLATKRPGMHSGRDREAPRGLEVVVGFASFSLLRVLTGVPLR